MAWQPEHDGPTSIQPLRGPDLDTAIRRRRRDPWPLVLHFLGLARHVGRRLAARQSHPLLRADELQAEAVLALHHIVRDTLRPERLDKARLKDYVARAIHQELINHVRRLVGRSPGAARRQEVRSVGLAIEDQDGRTIALRTGPARDPLPADGNPHEEFIALLRGEPRRTRLAATLYYKHGFTMKQTAAVIKTSESRVSGILRTLRNHIASRTDPAGLLPTHNQGPRLTPNQKENPMNEYQQRLAWTQNEEQQLATAARHLRNQLADILAAEGHPTPPCKDPPNSPYRDPIHDLHAALNQCQQLADHLQRRLDSRQAADQAPPEKAPKQPKHRHQDTPETKTTSTAREG